MRFIINCFKGIAIGAGAILPGISSGVLCVIFGIYETLLDSILNFFHQKRKNIIFLLPLILGGGIGIILFGNLLNYLLYQFPLQTNSIFIGLILGCIPPLIKEVHQKEPLKPSCLLFFFTALFIGIFSVILENYLPISTMENNHFLFYILCGFFMSIGVVVPGVSSTIILMLLGVYSTYLASVASLNFLILIPIGIGLMIGGFFFMKLTKYLLDHFYAPTFSCIIGFTIGSIFVLLPSPSNGMEIILCLLSTILGLWITSFFE